LKSNEFIFNPLKHNNNTWEINVIKDDNQAE